MDTSVGDVLVKYIETGGAGMHAIMVAIAWQSFRLLGKGLSVLKEIRDRLEHIEESQRNSMNVLLILASRDYPEAKKYLHDTATT